MRGIGKTVDDIIAIVDRVRKRPAHDLFDTTGVTVLRAKLYALVSRGDPINFLLPAFPCKSPNTIDKVLGTLPDKAEDRALDYLHEFCSRISSAHGPGCNLLIFADGRVYSDLIGVSDGTINAYMGAIKAMSASTHIHWSCLDNFFPGMKPDDMRKAVVDNYGKTMDTIKDMIANNPDKLRLYLALTRFLVEDRRWPATQSKTNIEKTCKARALEGMQRNDAYGAMLKHAYPDHIRLSIHPHSNAGDKIGINLLPGGDGWGTPWHNVLVERKDGTLCLMKKRDAVASGYTLVFADERPSHFVEK